MEEKLDYIACQNFNDSLDEAGEFKVLDFSILPSKILYELDYQNYKAAYLDFEAQSFEEFKENVFNLYPSNIAYNFKFSERKDIKADSIQRLLRLKDSWESIVFFLHALVWAEIRAKQINLSNTQVITGYDGNGVPIYYKFNSRLLLSDALKEKIQNIRTIRLYSINNSLSLKSELISEKLLDTLFQLQDIRNDISHNATPTEEQAEADLIKVEPLVKEMLYETEFLRDCKTLRFESYTNNILCEVFNGHALNKDYEEIDYNHKTSHILSFGQEQLFVLWENEIFSLSPFLHFEKDSTGHESYLCVYKGKRGGKYLYEPTKLRNEISFDSLQTRFDSEKNDLLNLF